MGDAERVSPCGYDGYAGNHAGPVQEMEIEKKWQDGNTMEITESVIDVNKILFDLRRMLAAWDKLRDAQQILIDASYSEHEAIKILEDIDEIYMELSERYGK